MTTALVTGGAGFLGSHVAERLCALGLRVVVLDDLSGGFEGNVPPGCTGPTNDIWDYLTDLRTGVRGWVH